jgi:predicted nucleic acid-binding protein
MIVISDNSPLSALAEAGLIDLLPKLYHEVVIPAAVALASDCS